MAGMDLDALERDFKRSDIYSTPADPIVLALIQRLRDAEVLCDDWRHVFHLTRLDLEVAQTRIAQLETAMRTRIALGYDPYGHNEILETALDFKGGN
jgi:hypothetical protein